MIDQKDLSTEENESDDKGLGFLFFGFVMGLFATYGFFVYSQSLPGSRMPAAENSNPEVQIQISPDKK